VLRQTTLCPVLIATRGYATLDVEAV
jgi:hypothetical protein